MSIIFVSNSEVSHNTHCLTIPAPTHTCICFIQHCTVSMQIRLHNYDYTLLICPLIKTNLIFKPVQCKFQAWGQYQLNKILHV